jgi:hypothetical protein
MPNLGDSGHHDTRSLLIWISRCKASAEKCTYLFTSSTVIFKLDSGENFTRVTPWTFLLAHLSGRAEFLEDHLGVTTAVSISVIITHVDNRVVRAIGSECERVRKPVSQRGLRCLNVKRTQWQYCQPLWRVARGDVFFGSSKMG